MTISGAITGNIWASEDNMSANVAINFVVDRLQPDGTITQIVKSARTTELGTSRTAQNFTATPGAGVACNKGDRLRIRIFGDDAGTMASGFVFTFGYNGSSAAADGDTYISFTETFGFQTTDPTGTTLYLTNNASAVTTANTDYEMWTSRGGGLVNDTVTSGAGWIAPIQVDDGSAVDIDWFTRPLEAFTLSGLVKCNVRPLESLATHNISVGVELAVVDGDGSGAVIWGYANRDAATTFGSAGELPTSGSETDITIYIAGDDIAVTNGQRLRLRAFVDDCANVPAASGTLNFRYNGTTGGAAGDTFLILPQTVTEFSAATPVAFPFPRKDRSFGNRDFDRWSVTGWQ